jgi:hypothetical protein
MAWSAWQQALGGQSPWTWVAALAVATGGSLVVVALLLQLRIAAAKIRLWPVPRRRRRGEKTSPPRSVTSPLAAAAPHRFDSNHVAADLDSPTAQEILARLRDLTALLEAAASNPRNRPADSPLKSPESAVEYVYRAEG